MRFRQSQEPGTRAVGSRWDRQVHTVRLAGDSRYAGPPRLAVSVYRSSDGPAGTEANTVPAGAVPAAIWRPPAVSVYRPEGRVRAPRSQAAAEVPGLAVTERHRVRATRLPVRDADGIACANGKAVVTTLMGPLCSG